MTILLGSISSSDCRKLNAGLRLIVGGIIAKDGCTVKGAIVFRKVKLNER